MPETRDTFSVSLCVQSLSQGPHQTGYCLRVRTSGVDGFFSKQNVRLPFVLNTHNVKSALTEHNSSTCLLKSIFLLLVKINKKPGFQEVKKKKKQVISEPSPFCSDMSGFNSVNYLTDGGLHNFAILLPALTWSKSS